MKKFLFGILVLSLLVISCKKEGCMDSSATNYDPDAKKDDGSCVFPDPRDPYLGSYWVTDSMWLSGSFYSLDTYALSITTEGTAQDTIYLNNLWNDGSNYIAIMAGSNHRIRRRRIRI